MHFGCRSSLLTLSLSQFLVSLQEGSPECNFNGEYDSYYDECDCFVGFYGERCACLEETLGLCRRCVQPGNELKERHGCDVIG